MIALISLSPRTIVKVFESAPNPLRVPDGSAVSGADAGWSNGEYAVVSVVPFIAPEGRMVLGTPSYSLSEGGDVVESYETQAIPPPAPITVTLLQAKLALNGAGLRNQVEAIIAASDQSTKDYWANAINVTENHPIIVACAAKLSPPLTAEQVHALFMAAQAIQT